jgi:hypothetical protein
MESWVDMMDRDGRANYGLVPNMQILELYRFKGGSFDCTNSNVAQTAITTSTIYNEAWMAVIHGRKGLSWYDNGSVDTTTNYASSICTSDSESNCFPADPGESIGKRALRRN